MTTSQPMHFQAKTDIVAVEFSARQLEALDEWISHSEDPAMSRPEAIRHILSKELSITHNFMDHPQKEAEG